MGGEVISLRETVFGARLSQNACVWPNSRCFPWIQATRRQFATLSAPPSVTKSVDNSEIMVHSEHPGVQHHLVDARDGGNECRQQAIEMCFPVLVSWTPGTSRVTGCGGKRGG